MLRVKTYLLELEDLSKTPTLEDIKECVEIAKNDNCIVELIWHTKWSGLYSRYIRAEDDPQKYFRDSIPHVYGL